MSLRMKIETLGMDTKMICVLLLTPCALSTRWTEESVHPTGAHTLDAHMGLHA